MTWFEKKRQLSFEEKMSIAKGTVERAVQRSSDFYPQMRVSSRRRTAEKFEFLIKMLFERMRFDKVHVVGGPCDTGIDLEAFDSEGKKIVIQCKHYGGLVGPVVLREFAHVIERDPLISQGYLVTSSRFSPEAKKYSLQNETCRNRMTLIDRETLIELLKEYGLSLDYLNKTRKKNARAKDICGN